ncbi:hypothetical protein [Mycoplasma sp. 'Moose RK']|uniref:hypothetical protein n=1 Tax=Mycoplasma sp. 'Moose RK' TaxID=2780095 RepID=UPI0018C25F47|nr:hypothetical protein [Mycoplasma sp. 'Moose RK']MBG0730737.1 hypothetical protein [Mycoplasma sp. 'Moose RK']
MSLILIIFDQNNLANHLLAAVILKTSKHNLASQIEKFYLEYHWFFGHFFSTNLGIFIQIWAKILMFNFFGNSSN